MEFDWTKAENASTRPLGYFVTASGQISHGCPQGYVFYPLSGGYRALRSQDVGSIMPPRAEKRCPRSWMKQGIRIPWPQVRFLPGAPLRRSCLVRTTSADDAGVAKLAKLGLLEPTTGGSNPPTGTVCTRSNSVGVLR
jgi:hypothetical protein